MSSLTLSLDISTTATGWAVFHGSDLVQSGVLKHKSKSFFERGRFMASELRAIQSRALQKYDEPFESIVVEKKLGYGAKSAVHDQHRNCDRDYSWTVSR